jgi:hypothetical protein
MSDKKLQEGISELLNWLCVEWGFCIPPDAAKHIAETQNVDAETFAREVLKAEGMNPDYEVKWLRKIKRRFVDEFGADRVDINCYSDVE